MLEKKIPISCARQLGETVFAEKGGKKTVLPCGGEAILGEDGERRGRHGR